MENKDGKALSITYGKKQVFKIQGRPMKIGDSHAATTTVAYDPEGKTLAVGKYFFFYFHINF